MPQTQYDLVITQGKTFTVPFLWATSPYIYKAITAVSNIAPLTITSTAHGLTDGWPVWIVGAGGLVARTGFVVLNTVNAKTSPPKVDDIHYVSVTDTDTVTLNNVNGEILTAYTSGGYIQYLTPVVLTGFSARLTIKDRAGGTTLWAGTSDAGNITVNNTTKKITLTITATETAAFTFLRGVYDLELDNGTEVHLLSFGNVTVIKEVTA